MQMPHSHTQVFFVFDPNHPHLFMLPTICLALALVKKKHGLFD